MKFDLLLPSTWNPAEAVQLLSNSNAASQGLSDLFILTTIYLSSLFLVGTFVLTLRSAWRTTRYRLLLRGVQDYHAVRESLADKVAYPLFREFNHHLVDIPKQNGSKELVLRRSVDAEEIFSDDQFAPGLSSNRIFQVLPGVLTGLGVLGTFVGLQLGIGGLDLHDLKKLETSIVPLIQGCAVAFSTSVWGVGASLVFSFLEKLLEAFAVGGVRKLQRRIDALVPRYVPEEAMAELARSSLGSENLLKGLANAIGDAMQEAIGKLGAEIKDAVAIATKEGQEPLAKQAAKLLSEDLTVELGELKKTIDGMGQRFTDDFGAASIELTRQVEAFGPTVSSLANSVTASHEVVSNAVMKLNAHESVMDRMGEASEKIKQASDTFGTMNGTLETSAIRNKDAAEAQHEAAKANQEVASKFITVGERLPELNRSLEDAAKVIGSLGGPLKDLKDLIETLPVKQGELETKRAESEVIRNDKLLELTNDLAAKVESAALKFAQAEGAAANLQGAALLLENASSNLGAFGEKVLQASQEQRLSSEASRDAASASKEATDALKPLPAAFNQASNGLALAGSSVKQGADSAVASYERVVDGQRIWFDGFEVGLSSLRDRIQEILVAYSSTVEGKTQDLMNQWTTAVTECLKSYGTQHQELKDSLEVLEEAINRINREN